MEVQGNPNGQCVEYAISIARIVLGYDTALPDRWSTSIKKNPKKITQLLGLAFPDRKILVWSEKPWYKIPRNVTYMGHLFEETNLSKYIVLFTYYNDNNAHMVIGYPAIYGKLNLQMLIAIPQ